MKVTDEMIADLESGMSQRMIARKHSIPEATLRYHLKKAGLNKTAKSKEEILAANPLADYHDVWNWGFITTERMTEMLYRSLTSE